MVEYIVMTKNHTVNGKSYGETVTMSPHDAEWYLKNGYIVPLSTGGGAEGRAEVEDPATHRLLGEIKDKQQEILTKMGGTFKVEIESDGGGE